MDLSGSYFEFIYLIDISHESQIDSRFIFVHKDILVIIQGCIKVSE